MSSPTQFQSRIVKVELKANLSAEEGFILSRIIEGMSVNELKALLPWTEEQSEAHLRDLIQKGALVLAGDSSETNSDFISELKAKSATIQSGNPFEILELGRNASAQDIRHQYLSISRKFHPDRFFKTDLGTYRALLNQVFAEITKAYQRLKDPHERENISLRLKENMNDKPKAPKKELLSKLKADPHLEKFVRAEEAYQEGLKHERAREFSKAYNCFNLALQMNPKRDEYKRAFNAMASMSAKERAKEKTQQAAEFALNYSADEAFVASSEALKLDPQNAEAQMIWARSVVELKKEDLLRDARERLLRAKVLIAKSPEPNFWLAKVYVMMGDPKLARQEALEALKKDPKHSGAQKILQEI